MYLQILNKDLKQKKTRNAIVFIFIILATMFIASSVNNTILLTTAIEHYFDIANVPDYWVGLTSEEAVKKCEDAYKKEEGVKFLSQEMTQVDSEDIYLNNEKINSSTTIYISATKNSTNVFDQEDQEISDLEDGEIYLPEAFCDSLDTFPKVGDIIKITIGDRIKEFTLKGTIKDAMFGTKMLGMTRFLVSENDYTYLHSETDNKIYSMLVYTEEEFMKQFNELNLNTVFNLTKEGIKLTYIIDMVIVAVMLIVSACLILISMVILRFTIQFTMSEEFREIGVMKAIGIRNYKIRGLYIVKYFAFSVVGGLIGLLLSIPFGKMLIGNVSRNIIIANRNNYFINILCTFGVVMIVILFCYSCTKDVKRISPIMAIRNDTNKESILKKGKISFSKIHITPISYISINDILCGMKRYIAMTSIFILGVLMIIIPVNTINTFKSGSIISWFSMAKCDHVIDKERVVVQDGEERKRIEEDLQTVKNNLLEHDIKADVFEEIMFRVNISYQEQKMTSIASQGLGEITCDQYAYIKGVAPATNAEIGISHVIADNLGVHIGDEVRIMIGEKEKPYVVTAIYQTLNNMGEGIRFSEKEELDYRYIVKCLGIQIKYRNKKNNENLTKRSELLKEVFPDYKVYTVAGYVDKLVGNMVGKMESLKLLILIVVLCINVLMTVLMEKSFITQEKGEIGMLKAIGFRNKALVTWQSLRIGIVLIVSIMIAVIIATPLTTITVGQVFKVMGALSIQFEIVPYEVYVVYPIIIFGVTIVASILAALQIRRISAAEASNIE